MNYLSIGTKYISKSLFQPIKNGNGFKPYGGIWATIHNKKYKNYNEWMDYVILNPYILFNVYKDNPLEIPAVYLTLKEKTNIFKLNNKEALDYLLKTYPLNNWIDFEKLTQNYDGIYIDILELARCTTKEQFNNLLSYSVNTLILFNPDCIDYYQKTTIKIDTLYFDPASLEMGYTINIDDNHETIGLENTDIINLLERIKKYIKDNNLPYDINSFLKLEQVFKNDINKTDIPIPKKEALLIRKAFHSI